ncbi:Diphosphomevalonate decarboxylase [Trichinella nativa]|uniref:Diphosphomevalonate decarboxylase n=4 Tax=Trichinella TaxID=6333 RepID=A0A0V1KZ71_9BILA|nr:Diphosphomevalonate decarboxylase [Trichinella britovi]KRZ52126.1 Diphosphomevalonate decarboxylase [Trichinella nativa]
MGNVCTIPRMSLPHGHSVHVRAPVNLALVKYWGKKDEREMLPLNDSLSMNINELFVDTRVTISDGSNDRVVLNGKEIVGVQFSRFKRCFDEARRIGGIKQCFVVQSESLFPVSAGLASSSAGFAAIAFAIGKMLNWDVNTMSHVARLGSGSACRGVYPGFVHWMAELAESNDTRNKCEVVALPEHWPELTVIVLIGSDEAKQWSSTDGMRRSVATSKLLKYRAECCVPERINNVRRAIQARDFAKLAVEVMRDSCQLHAICLDTYPPLLYLTEFSRQVMLMVHHYNDVCGRPKVAYSFDAGSNCFLLCLESEVEHLLAYVCHYFCDTDTMPVICGWTQKLRSDLSYGELDQIQRLPGAVRIVVVSKVGSPPTVLH